MIVRLFSRFFPRQRDTAAANNALLVEHYLGMIELGALNPFARMLATTIVQVLRAGGMRGNTAALEDSFNGQDRMVQLNIIALALGELGIKPKLRGEFWYQVKNPFAARHVDQGVINVVARRLGEQYGEKIAVAAPRFVIGEGVVTDPASTES